MRYGKQLDFKVKLTEAPSDAQVASNDDGEASSDRRPASYDKLGISVEPLTADEASRASISESLRGLQVTDVDVNGPAYRQLAPGNIIVKVLSPVQRPVRTEADLDAALAKVRNGDVVSLLAYNTDAKQTFVVNLRVGG